jgi:hypothetical protein
MRKYPDRDEVIARVAKSIYGETILNNSHRGDVVEMMVLAALGEEWSFVGLGWHPWDIQRGSGKTPSYFERDNPDEPIEKEGWFCEIFVFGVHQELDPDKVDQVDSKQWKFLVVPTCDLKKGAKSITLTKALNMWPLCMWHELPKEVDEAIRRMGQIRASRI